VRKLYYILIALLFVPCCKDPNNPTPQPSTTPSVSLDPISVIEGNEGQKAIFASVRLSAASTETVSIFVETEDDTATAGSDYVALSKNIDFAPGVTQENIRLDIIGDAEFELDEEFTLKIVNVTGATLGKSSVSILIENDDTGTGEGIELPDGFATPDEYPGMELIWSDEFDGTALNESDWTFELGNGNWGWGNNELQFYRKENTTLVDGNLVITALEENIGGFNYTSSRIITKDKFEFQYGRIDIRAVLPEGQGIWPALWMLGQDISSVSWPACGEIDIMELLGHQPGKVHGTVHRPNANGDHIFDGTSTSLGGTQKFSDEYHVFSLIWQEDKMEILLDNEVYFTATRASLGAQNPYPFNDSFFFIFNVAVGGQWPGSPDATTVFPQRMIVDYVRVFQ